MMSKLILTLFSMSCLVGLINATAANDDETEVDGVVETTEASAKLKCGYLVNKVVSSIKYHLGRRTQGSFVSDPEAKLFSNLQDGENGREVLTNTMRVLGNFSLAEGVMTGSLWTIDNQNDYISCEENINTRLEEGASKNEFGDTLLQGDMAVTTSLCRYSEQSSKVSNFAFKVGTKSCLGVAGCQFSHPDEAVHFCNNEPECTLVMGKAEASNCDGGLGCYMPKKGKPVADKSWGAEGGRTYIKHCPGALLETQTAVEQGLRQSGTRWHDGEVNYCFSAEASDVVQEAFHIAVGQIQKQTPCLKFNLVNRVNDSHCNKIPSIIVQTKPTGCWSYVGQVSGKEKGWKERSQPLNLARGCELVGTTLHQLGHALGMVHENSRADRSKVMKFNVDNVSKGKEMEFAVSQDVVKYAWSGYETCTSRAGRTRVSMTKTDCLKVKGFFDKGGDAKGTLVQCQLDLCEDGVYFPAPTNMCKAKVASMSIKMERKDCMTAKGSPATAGESWQWTDCHFDLCTDAGLHMAKPFACENKMAYGYIETTAADCNNMQGSLSVTTGAGKTNWVNCYFDFCSGQFDVPFDFLSLMMYSPYSFSKAKVADLTSTRNLTLEPTGNHGDMIAGMMGQRMGFSALDIFHLGHMYNCWDKIKPDFDSQDVSRKIVSGEFFEYNGTCEDQPPERTGFDVHGKDGFMKHAPCADLSQHCKNATMGEQVRKACPASCFECMPNHGHTGSIGSDAGPCFDAKNTGIRFRDGPKASCKDLVHYCNHATIGPQVSKACKLSCGFCDLHVYAPFHDSRGKCGDLTATEEPQFTIGGKAAECIDMPTYCQNHPDSYLVQKKCAKTCGLCGAEPNKTETPKTDEIQIPGDSGGCARRRRFGFCSSRRRRNV